MAPSQTFALERLLRSENLEDPIAIGSCCFRPVFAAKVPHPALERRLSAVSTTCLFQALPRLRARIELIESIGNADNLQPNRKSKSMVLGPISHLTFDFSVGF
jgi:hypothetical protein